MSCITNMYYIKRYKTLIKCSEAVLFFFGQNKLSKNLSKKFRFLFLMVTSPEKQRYRRYIFKYLILVIIA